MQPASVSSRFAALNLDCLVYVAICQTTVVVIDKISPAFATVPILLGLNALWWVLYFVYPLTLSGQTLGKKLLSVKVVHKYDEREPLTWSQAFQRELIGKTLSGIPLGLGYLWAYTNEDRVTWHDSMSRTEVVSLIQEEEKTTAQKLQHVVLAILMVPAGLGLIFGTLLYTSMPLDSIREQIEARGIQVGALTGSIAGGLHFSEIRRNDEVQNFHLESVDVKFSLWSVIAEKTLYIEKLTAKEGRVEVPESFAWINVFNNLVAMGEVAPPSGRFTLGKFVMGRLQFKNIEFQHQNKTLSHLEELSIKNLTLADKELLISELQFQIPGFKIKANDFKSANGRIEISDSLGGIGPEVLPILKVPVDFHMKGSVGRNASTSKIEGGLMIDKIKVSYEGAKFSSQIDQLVLNEMFKTVMPIDGLSMKLTGDGLDLKEIMSTLQVEYEVKLCGNEFKPDAQKILRFERADRKFAFQMIPKPVPNLNEAVVQPEATFDDLFTYQLQGVRQTAPNFASHREMWADLCFQKPVAGLQPADLENISLWEKGFAPKKAATEAVVEAKPAPAIKPTPAPSPTPSPSVTPPGATPSPTVKPEEPAKPEAKPAAEAEDVPAPEETTAEEEAPVPEATPEKEVKAAASPLPSPSPTPPVTAESIREALAKAKTLLRQGKLAEARAALDAVTVTPGILPPQEYGSFYNVKGWIYLYLNQNSLSVQSFEWAFEARKDIGDAEGLLRSHEAMKNEKEVQKWTDYIKGALKQNPGLKNQLTANMQQRMTNEDVAKEHP